MLSAIFPRHAPSPLCHIPDKLFPATARLHCVQTGNATVCYKTIFCLILHQMVFILAPCTDRSLFQFISMKIFTLLCHAKPPLDAHPISKILHTLQIFLGIMQLVTIYKTDGIGYNVAMHMISVYMHTYQTLESGKPLFRKFLSKLQSLLWCNCLILMP